MTRVLAKEPVRLFPDTLDRPGAERLAARINNYWLRHGYVCRAIAVRIRRVWCVRSDIGGNGFPPQRVPRIDTLLLLRR